MDTFEIKWRHTSSHGNYRSHNEDESTSHITHRIGDLICTRNEMIKQMKDHHQGFDPFSCFFLQANQTRHLVLTVLTYFNPVIIHMLEYLGWFGSKVLRCLIINYFCQELFGSKIIIIHNSAICWKMKIFYLRASFRFLAW